MFGLSPWLLLGGAAGYVLAAGLGWAALHEYGLAQSQSARDQAQIAQVEAQATASALAQQQAIDAAQAKAQGLLYARGTNAVAWLARFQGTSAGDAERGSQEVREAIRTEPVTACARQPIPPAIMAALKQTVPPHAALGQMSR